MYVSDRFVFVELQKTGGTHITGLLSQLVPGEQVGRHNRPPDRLIDSDRIFLGSIRNPWDWYVSLWAFGCAGRGSLRKRLTNRYAIKRMGWKRGSLRLLWNQFSRSEREAAIWKRCYADVRDPGAFREWLHRLHDPAIQQDLGDGYAESRTAPLVGFMTYRFGDLYSRPGAGPGTGEELTLDRLKDEMAARGFVDHWIRTESLEDDLIAALRATSIPLPDDWMSRIRNARPTNVSVRAQGTVAYHDRHTVSLLERRESLIIERFGYTPPA